MDAHTYWREVLDYARSMRAAGCTLLTIHECVMAARYAVLSIRADRRRLYGVW